MRESERTFCGLAGDFQKPEGADAIVLMAHGFMSGKDNEGAGFSCLARELSGRGIASFRFNFRYTAPGWDEFHKMSVLTEARDLKALTSHFAKSFKKIGVVGASFGGMVANLAWSPRVGCLVLWYPVAFPLETDAEHNRLTAAQEDELKRTERVTLTKRRTGETFCLGRRFFRDIRRVDPSENARRIRCPVLIIHPRGDTVVGFSQSKRLFKALGGREKKLVATGGNHGWKNAARTWHDEALMRKAVSLTADWFEKYLLA